MRAVFKMNVSVLGAASVVGYMERGGPIGHCFDFYESKKEGGDRFGQDTFEKAESEMQRMALEHALTRSKMHPDALDGIFAGDLLNQCVGSAYGMLQFDVPYFGLYGACSTAAEGLMLAGLMVDGGRMARCAAVVSSHNCTAERQYRTPLEYGGQRTPTSQWTVTGAGAFVLGRPAEDDGKARLTAAMPGIVCDRGITDTNNMGAAMAPAAVHTLLRFLRESGTSVKDYDAIVTGDLGYEGGSLFCDFARHEGVELGAQYQDCGQMIYCKETQDVHAGGSGCGCSAVVLASYLLPKLQSGEIGRMILMGTGAMMSPSSIQQGMSIPAIAHLLVLESPQVASKKGSI